jgi:HSP20 family protein
MKRNALLPSTALANVERGFGRLFEDLFEGIGLQALDGRRFAAPLDLIETPEAWRLTVDLPGVPQDAIDISLEDGVLELRAERPVGEPIEGEQARYVERARGTFARRLRLPGEVEADGVEADLADGVLTVTLPKASAARPRKIEVRGV